MKILFFVPYPLKESPSQRFRFEQYFTLLKVTGISFDTQSFLSEKDWQLFYKPGFPFQKGLAILKGFLKRLLFIFRVPAYDFIFIHREMTPIGPPVFEWVIAKIFDKKIIYDFDDAIWLTDRKNESALLKAIKCRSKVKHICQWSYKVSCGNEYLQKFALVVNSNSIINPTTLDTNFQHNPSLFLKSIRVERIVIGWTGSHSTLKYLDEIVPCLQRIGKIYPAVKFLIIADKKPKLALKSFDFVVWNRETEIQDLTSIDIGIMPLPDDEWSRGKCGFKALQYMALGIPALASPVGVNTKIIDHGVNGFLCRAEDEWFLNLRNLILDPDLRVQMGREGRKKVIHDYSMSSNALTFLSLFE